MPLSVWIGLILCNIAWSINPSVAKILIHEVGPQHTAWLKYASALIAYLVAMAASGTRPFFLRPLKRNDLWAVVLIGICTCFISPLTQMFGLQASSAVNNCVLVTFEPLFTVLFGWLLFREGLHRSHLFSFALAIAGFFLLSDLFGLFDRRPDSFSASIGDLILLVAIAGEAMYSVLARTLTRTYPPTVIFGTAIAVGVVLLSAVVIPWKGLPDLHSLSLQGWLAVLWIGVIGTTIPYLYWLHALNRSLSLGSVVLSLFLQPVFGTLAGIVFLGETLHWGQLAGGLLILSAVGIQSWWEWLQIRKA